MIDSAFYGLDPAELASPARYVSYPLATLKALSPLHWALMELHDASDLPILQTCYAAFAALSPDRLDFRHKSDMSGNKDLLIEKQTPGLLAVFEGKMFWQYRHVFGTLQPWLNAAAFDQRLTSKKLHRIAQDLGVAKAKRTQHANAVRFDRDFVRLAFREIARDTDERSLIFSLLPKNSGYGHTLFADVAKSYFLDSDGQVKVWAVSPLRLLLALAWFNNLPVDWLARFMIQISVSKTHLHRLYMPQPTDAEIMANPDFAQLAKNALLLSLAASWSDFAELAHVLRSFKVMAHKRPEYLTLLT